MTEKYNITIDAGYDNTGSPSITFSMDELTQTFLENIAVYNNITIGEFVASLLVNQTFETNGKTLN